MPQQEWNPQAGSGDAVPHNRSAGYGGGDTYNNNHHGIFGGRNNTNRVVNHEASQFYDGNIPVVPLDVFCARYGLDEDIKNGLKAMQFQPGDPLEDVKSWEKHFSELPWNRVKKANQLFITHVQAGVWKEYEKV